MPGPSVDGYLRRVRDDVADLHRKWEPEKWEHGLQAALERARSVLAGGGYHEFYDNTGRVPIAGARLLCAAGCPRPTSTFRGSRRDALNLIDQAIELTKGVSCSSRF